MNLLEIILIVLGIIVIFISGRLVDRSQKSEKQNNHRMSQDDIQFTEEELKQWKDKLSELMLPVSEEIIIRTDDELSKLSNEKIIAVGEFSDQIIDKINRNHEEVIFLYNMLNDKEKELKAVVKEIDTSKKKVQDILDSKKELAKEQPVKKPEQIRQTGQQLKSPRPSPTKESRDMVDLSYMGESGTNSNTQILDLYAKGKSVVEISKLLGLGQGEVKLVIDLFRGRK